MFGAPAFGQFAFGQIAGVSGLRATSTFQIGAQATLLAPIAFQTTTTIVVSASADFQVQWSLIADTRLSISTAPALALLARLTNVATYTSVVLADLPTAFWRLNETSGTTAVDSAGGNNGTISGSVGLGSGSPIVGDGTAMVF